MNYQTIYHRQTGAAQVMDIDAAAAVGQHPLEWKHEPWTDEEKAEAEKLIGSVKVDAPATTADAAALEDAKIENELLKEKAAALEAELATLKAPPPAPPATSGKKDTANS